MAPPKLPRWEYLMRFATCFVVLAGWAAFATAQQIPQAGAASHVETGHAPSQTREDVMSQLDRLTSLVEQQQKQIEQLQKSQAELLQEITLRDRCPRHRQAPPHNQTK